jgi:hypothetical protein
VHLACLFVEQDQVAHAEYCPVGLGGCRVEETPRVLRGEWALVAETVTVDDARLT